MDTRTEILASMPAMVALMRLCRNGRANALYGLDSALANVHETER
jgi:hypothetical protein